MHTSDGTQSVESVARKYVVLRPHLDERQVDCSWGPRRGSSAEVGSRSSRRPLACIRTRSPEGFVELVGDAEPAVRVRAPGGGRKSLAKSDPGLLLQLKAFVDPETRGDPMSLLVWTTKSTRNLADALTQLGHRVSDRTVARMLIDLGFSLQGNTKVLEGNQHADRDAQFRYLHGQVTEHAAAGQPVISVDTKRKELVGTYKNGGKEYQPAKSPEPVNVHDFPDKELRKAIRTGSTTCPRTPDGYRSAPTTTPPRSLFKRSAAGGKPSAEQGIPMLTGC